MTTSWETSALNHPVLRHLIDEANALPLDDRITLLKGLIPGTARQIAPNEFTLLMAELLLKGERLYEALNHPGEGRVTRLVTGERDLEQHEKDCITACNDCATACGHCFAYMTGEASTNACPACCIECAAICSLCADAIARHSPFAKQLCKLCADVCDWCAKECGAHDMGQCKVCADSCRKCAAACRKMAG